MSLVYVKPREGGRVRMPDRMFNVMPATGDWIDPNDMYWQRLLIAGDVVESAPPERAPAPADETAAAEETSGE